MKAKYKIFPTAWGFYIGTDKRPNKYGIAHNLYVGGLHKDGTPILYTDYTHARTYKQRSTAERITALLNS